MNKKSTDRFCYSHWNKCNHRSGCTHVLVHLSRDIGHQRAPVVYRFPAKKGSYYIIFHLIGSSDVTTMETYPLIEDTNKYQSNLINWAEPLDILIISNQSISWNWWSNQIKCLGPCVPIVLRNFVLGQDAIHVERNWLDWIWQSGKHSARGNALPKDMCVPSATTLL